MNKLSKIEWAVVLAFFVVVLAVRLAHMTGPLDEPAWRQSWCAYQARQLAAESPPEFLRVKINYKGTNDVSVWNFPIYEGVVAMAYKAVGGESLPLARVITLLFFLGSAYFLHAFVRILLGPRVALYSALAYLCLPLGIFYSRAVHYDIAVLFFCHLFGYAGLRCVDRRRWSWFVVATLAATAAFLMKPPYCFYFALPVAVYALAGEKAGRWPAVFVVAGMLVVPFVSAWWFHEYRLSLEGNLSESVLNPFPYTRAGAQSWFFGSLAIRFAPDRWLLIVRQIIWLVLTPVGVFMAVWALLTLEERAHARGWLAVWGLLAGVLSYVLLVFPMVSSAHDYYLLPLLAPSAILLGAFLESLSRPPDAAPWKAAIRLALTLCFVLFAAWYAIRHDRHFDRDWQRIEAGAVIRENTQPGDLVVSSTLGRSTALADPRILYFAQRRGWSTELAALGAENLAAYVGSGARYVALLITPECASAADPAPLLAGFSTRVIPIRDPVGAPIGSVVLFDLHGAPGGLPARSR